MTGDASPFSHPPLELMRTRIPHVLRAVQAMPWAIVPEKLEAIMEVLSLRAAGGELSPEDIRARIEGKKAQPSAMRTQGKIAVLPLYGVVSQRMNMMTEVSGGTSTEQFAANFDTVLADPSVSAIVIDVDSPGGSVSGVPELADHIRESRGQKPIIAVANGLAASAAYWIASAADELVVAPSGEVGSIGVFCVHCDASEAYAEMGLKHTIIKAGEYKAEGTDLEPLSKEALAYAQEQIDEYYSMFVASVAKSRAVGVQTVQKNFGQGRSVMARMAVAAGMADRIGTLESVVASLGATPAAYRGAKTTVTGATETLPILQLAASATTSMSVAATTGTGASGFTLYSSDTNRPLGQGVTVPDSPAGQAGPATPTVDHVAVERQRARDITALCREHQVDDANFAESLIERGVSVDAAAREILVLKKAQTKATSPTVSVSGMVDRAADRPFATLGDQLIAVMKAGRSDNRELDPRLKRMAAISGMSETVPADGGFAVQVDFAQEIWKRSYQLGEILSRVRKVGIGANSNGLKMNAIDETSRANGSRYGGVQVFWANEADAATAKKPKMRQMELNLRKLIALWFVTDELLQDSTALSSIARDAFAEEITFVCEDAIVNGTGVGQPAGVLKSASLVTQTAEGGQTATTFNTANAAKMFGRLWPRSMQSAAWFINQDVYQQLLQLTIGSSQWPVWIPPGGLSAAPYGSLYGRPVVPVEYAQSLGTKGDVLLADYSQYLVIDKGGPLAAESMHVRFQNDEMTYRLTYRIDGQPIWNSTLTPKNGSNTLSPFISLAAR